MNCILRTALAITIVVGFSGTHASKVLWACGGACSEGGGHSNQESSDHIIQAKAEVKGEKAEAVKDPVCGMEVDNIKKAPSEKYKGKVYYFCSKKCVEIFKKGPAPYTCGCATIMKDCDCGHCKGKEETCPCPLEHEKGEAHEHSHEHTEVESHGAKEAETHKHN